MSPLILFDMETLLTQILICNVVDEHDHPPHL